MVTIDDNNNLVKIVNGVADACENQKCTLSELGERDSLVIMLWVINNVWES